MAYNFIDAVSKTPFSGAVRKVWYGGAFLLALLLAASAVVHSMSGGAREALAKEKTVQETLVLQSDQLTRQQAQFEFGKVLRQQTRTANVLMADQLFDLLDLVPDDATLERFEFNETSVIFAGVCRRFDAMRTDMSRALSGQYRIAETTQTAQKGQTRFMLRFTANGEMP